MAIRKKRKLDITKGKVEPKGISIANMHYQKPYRETDVRCDRVSPLGSPFYLRGDESKREAVCEAYQHWFESEVLTAKERPAYKELMRLLELYREQGRLRLFCWCSPKHCHCSTIAAWLERNV